MHLLQKEIELIFKTLHARLYSAGLYRKEVTDDDVEPEMATFLEIAAQQALDVVRMYVFSHVEWLIHLDTHPKKNENLSWTSLPQRNAWLQSLQNNVGSKGVEGIFKVFGWNLDEEKHSPQ